MAKEDKIVRFPRPLGTTAMILEYQKSGNPEDLIKVQNYLINQWLLGNGVLCRGAGPGPSSQTFISTRFIQELIQSMYESL